MSNKKTFSASKIFQNNWKKINLQLNKLDVAQLGMVDNK